MGGDFHKRICNRLINSDDNTEMELGLILDELRQLRNDADYNGVLDYFYFDEKLADVKANLQIAFQQLTALRSSPPFKL